MGGAGIAIIVVLVLLIGYYLMTRGLPGANPPVGPCTRDSDCTPPRTCANGTCADSGLAGLIQAAQAAAAALCGALQAQAAAFTSTYWAHAVALQTAAVTMGLSSPSLGSLQTDLAAGLASLTKVINYLSVPGCAAGQTGSCGYCAEMAAMPPGTAGGLILSISDSASPAVAELPNATSAFTAIATDLTNIIDAVTADAEAKHPSVSSSPPMFTGQGSVDDWLAAVEAWQQAQQAASQPLFDANTTAAMAVVESDAARLTDLASGNGTLARMATAVTQTGYALNSHLLS